eukprot:jgi/Bigna1/126998/aug1.3_g1706
MKKRMMFMMTTMKKKNEKESAQRFSLGAQVSEDADVPQRDGSQQEGNNEPGASNKLLVPSPEDRLDIYAITSTHGLKGHLKAQMLTDSHMEEWDRLWIRYQRGDPREILIEENRETVAKGGRSESIIKIKDVDSLDEARELVGGSIFVDALEEFVGEFDDDADDGIESLWPEMWDKIESTSDLIGYYTVLASTQEVIGQIEGIESNGIQDLLVIRYVEEGENGDDGEATDSSKKTFLVPFVEALVPIVDTEEKMVVLAEIEGLY